MRGIRAVLLCLLLPTSQVLSQMLELQPGARVRVRADGALAGRLTGIVIARSSDSLTLARSNLAPLTIPMSRLTAVEISRGKSHKAGAAKGLVIGVGVGLLLGLTPIPEADCRAGVCDAQLSRAEFIGTMMVGSAGLGAGIGAITGSERWDRYLVPARVGLTAPSRTRGLGLTAQWALP